MIKIEYYGLLRQLTGTTEETMDAKRVGEVIKQIKKRHGKEATIEAKMSFILVNGTNAALLKGYRTVLKDGDLVQIMPVTAGG